MATAGTPWMAHSAAAPSGIVVAPAESIGAGSSIALAVQQHLLLASTAKAGPVEASGRGEKEKGHASRQATLTAAKPPAATVAGSPARELTSGSVRMRLHALLETV